MNDITFKALNIFETESGFSPEIIDKKISDLPDGDLVIKVHYSSLNYKDALSISGNRGVTRNYPHTPGIDASGEVVESGSPAFTEGDKVIITGYDFGMNTSGGYQEYARIPSTWAVKLPSGLSLAEAMVYGTAGFTAAMSADKIFKTLSPEDGEIIVSGATGGVGSIAVRLLAAAGYRVAAVTGKPEKADYLKSLGASSIVERSSLQEENSRPMLKAQYAGAVDTVGGNILANIIKSIAPLGTVTSCGNAASADLPLSVYPFILRGISLIGIDSQNCPMEYRQYIWNHLATDWKLPDLLNLAHEISLSEVAEQASLMLKAKASGRALVKL